MSPTTTPWARDEVGPDAHNTNLTVNLIFRLILGPAALVASWVPFRLLWRNGEFAAVVMTATNWILILFLVVNAAIWHDDDHSRWWRGYGWCDIQMYCQFSMTTIYGACVCAIMRRLAKQVGLMRVTSLSARERRNRTLVQILIIFPVPTLQVALTYLVQSQRYTLMPINGCGKAYDANAIYLIFFVLPSPLFTAFACFYAYQTYHRFKGVQKTTRAALNSNSIAASRSQRAKRKLYVMALCILIPYAPVELLFLIFNVLEGWPWTKPYDFNQIHNGGQPSWNTITLLHYDDVSFAEMNMNWIPVITVIVIFLFFGTGKEAINTYRRYLLAIGLGRVIPGLKTEYDPDRRENSAVRSWASQGSEKPRNTMSSGNRSNKGSTSMPASHHFSLLDDSILSDTMTATTATTSSPQMPAIQRPPLVPPPRARATRPAIPNPGLNWSTPPRIPSLTSLSLQTLLGRTSNAAPSARTAEDLRSSGAPRPDSDTHPGSVAMGAWTAAPVQTRVWSASSLSSLSYDDGDDDDEGGKASGSLGEEGSPSRDVVGRRASVRVLTELHREVEDS